MRNLWLGLADGVLTLHYAFVVYLVAGGFLAWRWRRTIVVHVLAAIWAVLIVTTKVPCPLTALQNQFRERAGDKPLSDSFINLYVRGTLFPSNEQTISRLLVAVVVITSWVGYRRVGRNRPAANVSSARPSVRL